MTWTYLSDFTTTRDKIRRLIGDVDTANQLLSDEEIAFYLTLEGGYIRAAAACCEGLAAAGSGEGDFSIGGKISQRASQSPAMYAQRAKELRRMAARKGLAPFAGGISLADKALREEDEDRVLPAFERNDFTEPLTEPQNNDEAQSFPIIEPF